MQKRQTSENNGFGIMTVLFYFLKSLCHSLTAFHRDLPVILPAFFFLNYLFFVVYRSFGYGHFYLGFE